MSNLALRAISLIVAIAALTSCGGRRITTAPQQPPQALDPLTTEERALAEKIARADPRAAELLGSRATVASLEFLSMKGDTDEPVRHADLVFARPDADFGARALVRLGADPAVVEFTRIDRRSLPLTQSEIQEAWKIALADAAYAKRLQRDVSGLKVEALRLYSQNKADPCFAGRCLYLMVRDGAFYVSHASVVVDLGTKRVLAERSPR